MLEDPARNVTSCRKPPGLAAAAEIPPAELKCGQIAEYDAWTGSGGHETEPDHYGSWQFTGANRSCLAYDAAEVYPPPRTGRAGPHQVAMAGKLMPQSSPTSAMVARLCGGQVGRPIRCSVRAESHRAMGCAIARIVLAGTIDRHHVCNIFRRQRSICCNYGQRI